MTFEEFSKANKLRCEQGFKHQLSDWSLSDWMTATMGELGEAANIVKKLNRVRDGIPGNDLPKHDLEYFLGTELADTFIYLDLLAQAAGINLEDMVRRVFNEKSDQIGSDIKV